MEQKHYSLEFAGYWREPNVGSLPAKSGIYGVYASTYDANQGTVSLLRLLYIGEGADVRDRVSNHERWQDWKRQLKDGGGYLCERGAYQPAGRPTASRGGDDFQAQTAV